MRLTLDKVGTNEMEDLGPLLKDLLLGDIQNRRKELFFKLKNIKHRDEQNG